MIAITVTASPDKVRKVYHEINGFFPSTEGNALLVKMFGDDLSQGYNWGNAMVSEFFADDAEVHSVELL